MKNYKEIVVLVAEDDDGHADLIQEGLKSSGIHNNIIRLLTEKKSWISFHKLIIEKCVNWIRTICYY
jgi:hypothetical protein